MPTKRMLVDATHPEETRIVVTSGNRVEEFDFESAARRQLRGNIYLAKVTRVEPSLQAAFVEYGGNRHGFLAFSEIHPDYYQIPVADREALLQEEEEEEEHESDSDDNGAVEGEASETSGGAGTSSEADAEQSAEAGETEATAVGESDDGDAAEDDEPGEKSHIEEVPLEAESVESIGGDTSVEEEVPQRRRNTMRRYKIQEVIKRRQVMLVQVVKEERGNKGAALTTYLSLAGRYSVLMPNTPRGGGISRKITNAADRKRLKEITSELEVPKGMGVILRTAGASRTKQEVRRDFEYLMQLWESVRNLTLRSSAPCLVYEEGSLIKRTIRDLFSREIDEMYVAGEAAYREAKDFMRMIMPSQAESVRHYTEDQPLFSKYNVETQLDSMFSPQVNLPSGGYIVINPTEALVSIDVNSGRATKEHNIEDTALQTNLEASEEIARQLRLRDLAGLIVIDFIDMMENRSNRAVERKLKECLKNDRARIQVGRISHFGLMEMSRQRIRFGVIESSTHKCPLCDGLGIVRSVESMALMVMRHVEDYVLRRQGQSINVRLPVEVALHILNTKRNHLSALEDKYDLSITIIADGKMLSQEFAIEKGEPRPTALLAPKAERVSVDNAVMEPLDEEEAFDEGEDTTEEQGGTESGDSGEGSRRRRRRRRRGNERGGENAQRSPQSATAEPANAEAVEPIDEEAGDEPALEGGSREETEDQRRRRRRGRRGGRRNRREVDAVEAQQIGEAAAAEAAAEEPVEPIADSDAAIELALTPVGSDEEVAEVAAPVLEAPAVSEAAPEAATAEEAPAKPRRARRTKAQIAAEAEAAATAPDAAEGETTAEAAPAEAPKPRRSRRKAAPAEAAEAAPAPTVSEPVAEAPAPEAQAEASPEAAPAPAEPEAPAPEAEETAAESRRRRRELPPEGVINASSSATPPEGDGTEKKKRAGWWQRRLGLGG